MDFSTPTWTQVGEMQNQIDELHAENALKLTQILGLEQLLYETRIIDESDGSPCWCCRPASSDGFANHDKTCLDARQATESFWKK